MEITSWDEFLEELAAANDVHTDVTFEELRSGGNVVGLKISAQGLNHAEHRWFPIPQYELWDAVSRVEALIEE
jgi:hypothetical protein